ncbi:MAG TPA: AbrB/MazE/SpoVT family DNA-binding domain-containing protein [Nitrospiria bacterium]|nr:AbrB/MazE/SpoVT family DNA-binding domain-containing protein [Nitrospiria bacterium]
MSYLKLSSKNQLVLPKEAREAMNVKGGDELLVVVKNGITLLMPRPEKYAQSLSGKGKNLYSKTYLKKERSSW